VASYDPPTSKTAQSDLKMVYPDYYALEFWMESMGFYVSIMAVVMYLLCLPVVLFFDSFARRKMLIKIYDRIKKREVFEGYKEEDDSISSGDDDNTSDSDEELVKADQEPTVRKRSKMKERTEMIKNEYNEVNNNSTMINESKPTETKQDMIEMNDLSSGMLFKNDRKLKKKLHPSNSKLYKGNTLAPPLPEEEKSVALSSKQSFRNSDSNSDKNKNSENNKSQSEKTSESEKEYERLRNQEDQLKEETDYYFWNIFKQGSFMQNFLWVDSYINPRHVRGTLVFTNTIFIWYYVAVVLNNSLDPKKVPDFDKKTRELTFKEVWISMTAPWAAMMFIYIFCLIMKVSPEKIRYTKTVRYLDYIIEEYKREQVLRYTMGYFIIWALNIMIFIYLIEFTSIHGWQTSWTWWNTGSLAYFINLFVYDPMAAIIHWGIYKLHPKTGRCIMRCRNIKIYRPEL